MTVSSRPDPRAAGERLRRFAEAHKLSATEVGRLLGDASHAAVLKWFAGDVPSAPFRAAIETLTSAWVDGPIHASEWGLTEKEQATAARLAGVTPFPASARAAGGAR